MSYLKNLTLLGKFSNSSGSIIPLAGADLGKSGFIDKVKPTVTREIVSATVGGRSFRYYRLVPPYGVDATKQTTLNRDDPSFSNCDKLIELNLADIELGGFQCAKDLRAYAAQGGRFFQELVKSLDVICKYNHGNFSQSVLQVAATWIESNGGLWDATFASAMQDQDLTDAIVGYLICTQRDEVTGREEKLRNFAQIAGLSPDAANRCLAAAKSCREAMHAATLGRGLESAINSSLVGDGRTLNDYRPFGDWDGSRENFFEAFQEYIKARALVENFIGNVSKHAYVMLFLFSKYSAAPLPTTATTMLNDPTVVNAILQTAIVSQNNRRVGLPAGEDEESVRRAVEHGLSRGLPDAVMLTQDQKTRHESTKLELEKLILQPFIPREITTRDAFLQQAEFEFNNTVHRILDDKALALVAELAKALEGFANEARAVFSNDQIGAQERSSLLKRKLNELGVPPAIGADFVRFVTTLKEQLGNAIDQGALGSYSALATEVGATLNVIKAKAIQDDQAGTEAMLLRTKQYSINLRTRVDVLGCQRSGAPGNPLALDAASVARVALPTNAVAGQQAVPQQGQAVAQPNQLQAVNQRLKKFRERFQESVSIRRSTPLTSNASAKVGTARPIQSNGYNSKVEFPGGVADITIGKGSEIKAEVLPASLGFSDLNDTEKSNTLSDTGVIVDAETGAEVGTYVKMDGKIESKLPDQVDRKKCSWVSGLVTIDSSKVVNAIPLSGSVAYEGLVGAAGIEVEVKSLVGNVNGQMFRNATKVVHRHCSDASESAVQFEPPKGTVVFEKPFVEGDRLAVELLDNEQTVTVNYPFKQLIDQNFGGGKCGIARIKIRKGADIFKELDMSDLVVNLDAATVSVTWSDARDEVTLAFTEKHFFPGQSLEYSGKKNLTFGELQFKPRMGEIADNAVKTPTFESELGAIEWGRLCYDVTLTESRMANQFQVANCDPLDYWPCFHRTRKFREQVLASHPDSVPFEQVDLGVTFEAIARMLRIFGNDEGNFQVGKCENLAIEKVDLSQCFPISTPGELVNIIKQYEFICHEDRRVDDFRKDIRSAINAVEALKGSDSRVTILNQTLDEAANGINRSAPNENFFYRYPSSIIFIHGESAQIKTGSAGNSLSEICGGMELIYEDQRNNIREFRHPIFTTDADVTFRTDWFIPARKWSSLPSGLGNGVIEVLSQRFERDQYGDKRPVGMPAALACAVALVLPTCAIGSGWKTTAGYIQADLSFGMVVQKCINHPWQACVSGDRVPDECIWRVLAHQRLVNLAFEHWVNDMSLTGLFQSVIGNAYRKAYLTPQMQSTFETLLAGLPKSCLDFRLPDANLTEINQGTGTGNPLPSGLIVVFKRN